MFRLHKICATILLLSISLTNALAQGGIASSDKSGSLTITASASEDRVRFTAPGSAVQIRVEIYGSTGKKLFDNELRGGNVIDWHLQDGQAEPVTDDTYVCVVTVKSLSGRITQRIGSIRIDKRTPSLQAAAPSQMTAQQTEAVGPVEENASLTVLKDDESQTATVIAHDGTDGQLVRGRGALSFRLGDFFAGKDKEQMRLTEEGNLGIGTSDPKVKLDVAGMIAAREGLMFSDGSTLSVNPKGVLTHKSAGGSTGGDLFTSAAGVGTLNRLSKWTDNSGTLGDSLVSESGGTGLQLTAPVSAAADTNILFLDSPSKTTGMLAGNVPSFQAASGPYFALRGNTYNALANQRGLFALSTGNVTSPVGNEGSIVFLTGADQLRMIIKPSGNVGIGTNAPQQSLSVNSAMNVDQASANVGALYPGLSFGSGSGEGISSKRTLGPGQFSLDFYTNFASRMTITQGGNVGIGTPVPGFKLDVADRMRVRQGGNGDAGIWFFQTNTNNDRAFVGMANDNRIGFYGNTGAGWSMMVDTTSGNVFNKAGLVLDENNAGSGGINSGIAFGGSGNGEGITSKRTAGGNQFGLDLFTGSVSRVSISNSGNVSIGGPSPSAKLYVQSTVNAVHGKNTGTSGVGGLFEITNPASPANALFVSTLGSGAAVAGTAFGNGDGIVGASSGGFAGNFTGSVNVSGSLFVAGSLQVSGSTKNFKIDHPLDPANKYLVHASIESSDVKNLYDGVEILNQSGEAIVTLPSWFEALNRDFRYQLSCIGGYAQVYIKEEIANHRFKIAGGRPGMKVSWQVTGIRQDPGIKAHPMEVEEAKPERERGYYLHPELYGQPQEKGIEWARRPEQMKRQREMLSAPKQ